MDIQTVNLEMGMPTVEMARTRLNAAIRSGRANRVKIIKFIHGYGSSGPGGAIKKDVLSQLAAKKRAGAIREFVKGEDFSPFSGEARRILAEVPAAAKDRDFNRTNHGVTLVLL